jgi:hypothetical protein
MNEEERDSREDEAPLTKKIELTTYEDHLQTREKI